MKHTKVFETDQFYGEFEIEDTPVFLGANCLEVFKVMTTNFTTPCYFTTLDGAGGFCSDQLEMGFECWLENEFVTKTRYDQLILNGMVTDDN